MAGRSDVETVTGEFPEELEEAFDPDKPSIFSAWGRKGSGKSEWNRRIYRSWWRNKLCIDVNGNADPGEDAEPLTGDLPRKWPAPAGGGGARPRNLHYRAQPGSATYREDLDRAVGLALFPQDQPTMLWAGECGELMPNGRPGPNMRTLLQQNRHYRTTALFDGPRPVNVDPLVLAQSDLVAVFHMPQPNDRKRIAETIGYPPRRFDAECEATWDEGPFWYLLWHTKRGKLYRMAPLPLEDEAAA